MNTALLTGNVGKDPVVRHLNDGTSVANFSLATSERWTSKDGEKKEKTEWHRVTVWGDGLVKNVIEKYVRKGSKLLVQGKIQTREWTDAAGVKRYATEIVVQGGGGLIELLGGQGDGQRNSPPAKDREPEGRGAGRDAQHGSIAGHSEPPAGRFDDEIPF